MVIKKAASTKKSRVSVGKLKAQAPKTLKKDETKRIKGGGYGIGGRAEKGGETKPGGIDRDGYGIGG